MKALTKPFCAIMAFIFLLAFTGCRDKSSPNPDTDRLEKEYNRRMSARTSGTGTTFEIKNITRKAREIVIEVEGGCSAEDYVVVWDGRILLTYPQIIRLVVANDAENCKESGKHTLSVNLEELLGSGYDPADFQVQVSNGSKVQDKVIDEQGAVSDR